MHSGDFFQTEIVTPNLRKLLLFLHALFSTLLNSILSFCFSEKKSIAFKMKSFLSFNFYCFFLWFETKNIQETKVEKKHAKKKEREREDYATIRTSFFEFFVACFSNYQREQLFKSK